MENHTKGEKLLRKIYASLIAHAVMLCAFIPANANGAGANSDKAIKSRVLMVGADTRPGASARLAQNASFGFVRAAKRANPDFETLSAPQVSLSNNETQVLRAKLIESVLKTRLLSNDRQIKTESPKRVNPPNTRTFYDLPPGLEAYNGIGFANLIRARPQTV